MALLQNDELDTILYALRKSISNIAPNCGNIFDDSFILKSNFLPKESASLSDVILATAKSLDGIEFKVALKMWFTWNTQTISSRNTGLQKLLKDEFKNDLSLFLDFFDIHVKPDPEKKKTMKEQIKEAFGYLEMDIMNNSKIWI